MYFLIRFQADYRIFILPVRIKYRKLTKTISVESNMIDFALSELAKLIFQLNKNSTKTRKEQMYLIKKIQNIRDTIQDAVLYSKLKKSVAKKSREWSIDR